MATTTTATTNFSSTVTADVKRRVLENLRARYAHVMPGAYIPAVYHEGTDRFTYTTYADFAAATTALTEGTPPTDDQLAISVETFSATQIGKTVAISDLAARMSPHNLASIAAERLANNASKTQDEMVREILVAGSSVFYAGTATSRSTVASSHVLTGALVKQLVERLQAADVPTFGNGRYRVILHPNQAGDLQRDTSTAGYVDIFKANEQATNLTELRTAAYAGADFVITSKAKVFATAGVSSANVFAALFFGPEAYAVNDLQSLNSYFVPPGGDHSDPLAQKAILGWKMAFGCKLLTGPGLKLYRLETGATYG